MREDHYLTLLEQDARALSAGYRIEGTACHVFATQTPGTVPLFKWYSSESTDHFYCINPHGELAPRGGYAAEGIACYVYPSSPSVVGTVPLYRSFNLTTGDHLYTIDENEAHLSGWRHEGVECAVYASPRSSVGTVPLYRWYRSETVHPGPAPTPNPHSPGRTAFRVRDSYRRQQVWFIIKFARDAISRHCRAPGVLSQSLRSQGISEEWSQPPDHHLMVRFRPGQSFNLSDQDQNFSLVVPPNTGSDIILPRSFILDAFTRLLFVCQHHAGSRYTPSSVSFGVQGVERNTGLVLAVLPMGGEADLRWTDWREAE